MPVESHSAAPIHISPRPSPSVSRILVLAGSPRSATDLIVAAASGVAQIPCHAGTARSLSVTTPFSVTNLRTSSSKFGRQTSGWISTSPFSRPMKAVSVPSSRTSASRLNFLAMPSLRIFAAACPDGQGGIAITRSAAAAGAATANASAAAQRNSRPLPTVPPEKVYLNVVPIRMPAGLYLPWRAQCTACRVPSTSGYTASLPPLNLCEPVLTARDGA